MDTSYNRTEADKGEWLTPPHIIKALGVFDLDPCAPIKRPWDMALKHYTIIDNGLMKEWQGRVWCNPPYGDETHKWLAKLADYGNGIALIFVRSETSLFFNHIWPRAHGIFFIKGRLTFLSANGTPSRFNAGAPSCLVAYGRENVEALAISGLAGKLVALDPEPRAAQATLNL